MTKRAHAAFTIADRQSTEVDWQGGVMSRARWAKTFTGEVAGSSVVEMVMLRLDNGGPSAYVALERFEGTVEERQGSFILVHSATADGTEQDLSLRIAPGSGTGNLAGIAGRAEILDNHEFVLEYAVLDAPAVEGPAESVDVAGGASGS